MSMSFRFFFGVTVCVLILPPAGGRLLCTVHKRCKGFERQCCFPCPFPCPSGVPCCENTYSNQIFTTRPATHGITNGQATGFTYYRTKKRTAASITETGCPLFFFYLIPILRGLKLLSKKTMSQSLRPE